MNNLKWSRKEKEIARSAFDLAYRRECASVIASLRKMADKADKPENIWDILDFLRKRVRKIEEKYDFRYSMLIFVFAMLLKEKWLKIEELAGIGEEKIEKIQLLAGELG